MYTNQAHEAASSVVSNLLSQKPQLTVTSRPNTVLSNMSAIASLILDPTGNGDTGYCSDETSSNAEIVVDKFDAYFGSVVDDLAIAVNNHISIAKNVVNPLVIDLADKIRTFTNTPEPTTESRFEIVKISLPSIVKDEFFLKSLYKTKGKADVYPKNKISIDTNEVKFNREYIQSVLSTGNADLDKELFVWLSSIEDELINHVVGEYFIEGNSYYGILPALHRFSNGVNESLLVYMLASKLFDMDPIVKGMTLFAYRDVLANYRDYAGARLCNYLDEYNRHSVTKTLVIDVDKQNLKAFVNEVVYKEWLASGGSVEVLYGTIVSAKRYTSVSAINIDKEKLLTEFNRYVTYKNSTANITKFNSNKAMLSIAFNELYTLSEVEASYSPGYDIRSKVLKDVSDYIELMSKDCFKNPDVIALELIARIRFYFTSSYFILKGICEIGQENPNAPADEAALLASLDYVVDYVMDQFVVKNG